MTDSHFLQLPDEILVVILEKLEPIDILCSLVGVNKRLNQIAGDVISRSGVNLRNISHLKCVSCVKKCEVDRLYSKTLPQLHEHIRMMATEYSSVGRILHSGTYPNLYLLVLIDVKYKMFSNDLSDDSWMTRLLKEQITNLRLTCQSGSSMLSTHEFSKNICVRIFALGEKLKTLDFRDFEFPKVSLSFDNLSQSACHSSTLLSLNISVSTFDDCLTLLDGRLPQMSTLNIIIRDINKSSLSIDHPLFLLKLKCFTLKSYQLTFLYDDQIVPLLRRMSNLEMLTLFLTIKNRETFVNGTQLNNELLVHMPGLNKFIFNIRSINEINNGTLLQSTEDIRNSFMTSKWSDVICWVDHFDNGTSLCNVLSLPFTMKHLDGITNSFPGGIFFSVRYLSMLDVRSFEHHFFHLIAQAFPSMIKLRLTNWIPQLRKEQHWGLDDDDDNNLNSSIVVYPNLRILYLSNVHNDYIEEFLHEKNSRLICLTQIQVKYEQLATATNNFTNEKMRQNCANLKFVRIDNVTAHPKNYYSYFPSLR